MNDLTFQILKIVLSVCSCLITLYLIPYVNRLSQNSKFQEVIKTVNIAVLAAEQTIKGDGKGAEKKEMAINYVSSWLSTHSIDISKEQIDGLIEAAVYGMNIGKES